jgi:small-conductance mechanosensitive channel
MQEILNYEILKFKEYILTFGSILFTFIVILFNVLLIKGITKIVFRISSNNIHNDGRKYAVIQLLKYVLWVITLIICLQIIGIDVTFIIASSAALLVGLGLGMQVIFSDFISGIILLIEGTIKVDDIIEVENEIMKVMEITLRTSRVVTRDEKVVIVPNHRFLTENVINWTHNSTPTRFLINVGVDYSSDARVVEKALLQAVRGNPQVIDDAPFKPFVRLSDFGASSYDFQLIFWSNNLFRIESTKSGIRFAIIEAFKQHNITIPFNQLVIHQAIKV